MKALVIFVVFISRTFGFVSKFRDVRRLRLFESNTDSPRAPVKKPTLSEESLWRLTIQFRKDGFESREATARIRFVAARNYEPPQGRIFVEDDYNGLIKTDDNGYVGSWTLSEDKNDRKDGLWIC